MPAVDYERAWLELKKVVLAKPSHGQRDLLQAMTQAEIASAVPEGMEGFDATPRSRKSADDGLVLAGRDD